MTANETSSGSGASKKRVTVPALMRRKVVPSGSISALTAYDFTMARLIDQAGVDLILVGDSLGCVVQGGETTIPVTLDEMIYHCRCVSRGARRALVVGDLPFLSYQISPEQAIESAGRLLKEGGVGAVKLEGGQHMVPTIERLTDLDIPVMGHIGLTPQSYHRMGGYRVQGKGRQSKKASGVSSAEEIVQDACALEAAGAFSVVLECIPADVAAEVTRELSIPTIGIGAGPDCDGQILVVNDLLGLTTQGLPSFVKRYADFDAGINSAVREFIDDINVGEYPAAEHCYAGDRSRIKIVSGS